MRTLATELARQIDDVMQPRIYADANLPAGAVAFMRETLGWDVFFVLEHDDLRRARDTEHFRLARQLRRTLLSLDRDYFDGRRFPSSESGGVLVISAPDEECLRLLLTMVHRTLFELQAIQLAGRKLRWDYGADEPIDQT